MEHELVEVRQRLDAAEKRITELMERLEALESKKTEPKKRATLDDKTIVVGCAADVPAGFLTSRQWLESQGIAYAYVAAGQAGQRAKKNADRKSLTRYGVTAVNGRGVAYVQIHWPIEAYAEVSK